MLAIDLPWFVKRLTWLHAAGILAVALLAVNWELVVGRASEKWDAYDFFAPYYSLVADFARAGQFLYWNPWTNGGSPDFAEPQVGAFSPILLLFGIIAGGSAAAFRFYWLTLWLGGGLGMLLLARHLRAPVWGGLVVALGFLFSGFYTGHAEHTSVIYFYSFLPFVIWRLDVALRNQDFVAAAQAGALWGLSALAGNPALVIPSVGLFLAWAIGRCMFVDSENRRCDWKTALLTIAIAVLVGTIVLLPVYFSFAHEGQGYSDRSQPLARDFAVGSNALHPGALASLSSPAFILLRVSNPSLWSYTDISSFNLYCGAATLFLATIALAGGTERKWRWFVFGLAIFALGCAISRVLPIRGWLYDLLVPTRYFRHSSMLRGYFIFLMAVLGIYGAKEIHARSFPDIRRVITRAVPLLALAAAATFAATTISVEFDNAVLFWALAHFSLVWGGLICIALAINRPAKKSLGWLPVLLLGLAVVDGIMACRFSAVTLYAKGTPPDSIVHRNSEAGGNLLSARRWLEIGRGDRNLFARIPTLHGYAPFKNRFHEESATDPVLAAIALGEERMWFAREAPEVALTQESFASFQVRVVDLGAPIIVRHANDQLLLNRPSSSSATDAQMIRTASAATRAASRVILYSPDKLMLECQVPEDGWLMVTDRWSRSWRCRVNGVEKSVVCADFIYRAVPVWKGNNRLEFTFEPVGMPVLIILSWSTLALTALLSLMAFPHRKRSNLGPAFGTEAACFVAAENGLQSFTAADRLVDSKSAPAILAPGGTIS